MADDVNDAAARKYFHELWNETSVYACWYEQNRADFCIKAEGDDSLNAMLHQIWRCCFVQGWKVVCQSLLRLQNKKYIHQIYRRLWLNS